MSSQQIAILLILGATVFMFLWGRWRHDMVAAGALLACVVAGLVPSGEAFSGFGHPAVITVACVLVLSKALQNSGAVDAMTRLVLPAKAGVTLSLAALVALGALLSSFMNNVGAMALLMPVAIQMSRRLDLMPGQVLMPLAFGTILGGMTTLIGTPPNLIVSSFRDKHAQGSFGMFDFTPVGIAVALGGVIFIVLAARWLVPARKQAGIEGFESGAYLTEARVPQGSKVIGKAVRDLEDQLEATGAQIVGLVQNEVRMTAPNPWRKIHAGDILVIEAEAKALASVLSALGLKLEEDKGHAKTKDSVAEDHTTPAKLDEPNISAATQAAIRDKDPQATSTDNEADTEQTAPAAENKKSAAKEKTANAKNGNEDSKGKSADAREKSDAKSPSSGEIVLTELAVLPGSPLTGRSAKDLLLRTRYGLNLLALSRQGRRSMTRLRSLAFRAGDLLLLQGPPQAIAEFASDNGCVPLAVRELRIPDKRKAWESSIIMALAIGGAAFGLLPAAISFAIGVLASMALRTIPPRAVYDAIDWPVIVLLAALIPVAKAMESTGTADLIARFLLNHVARGHAVIGLVMILLVTMFLSDLMNNAATAAVMCPIAIGTATALGANIDPFLMAVAIGASCAFLTPIGHQNNTLILGPGGFHFSDYWRLGLPLEIVVVVIGVPMLLWVWPL